MKHRTEKTLRAYFNKNARYYGDERSFGGVAGAFAYGVRLHSKVIWASDTRELWTKFIAAVNAWRVKNKRKPVNVAV